MTNEHNFAYNSKKDLNYNSGTKTPDAETIRRHGLLICSDRLSFYSMVEESVYRMPDGKFYKITKHLKSGMEAVTNYH